MKILYSVDSYCILGTSMLLDAIGRLDKNTARCLIVVDQEKRLIGTLTAGDINRYIMASNGLSRDVIVSAAVNRDCVTLKQGDFDLALVPKQLSLIPLIDTQMHVIGAAVRAESFTKIQLTKQRAIGPNEPVFVIAEIGNNHNGSIERAKELVRKAAAAGADCAKFQLRNMESLYGSDVSDDKQNLGAQYTLDLLRKFQLSNSELVDVMRYAESLGMVPLCTPWDEASVDLLESFGVPAYKVASADLTNHGLLKYIAHTGKPLICSTGMATESEIAESVAILKSLGAQYVLLHCNSTYPTPFKDVNLAYISRLKTFCEGYVGYSGHERDIYVPLGATALGACVIEKHLTLDRGMEGNDHKVSLLAEELSAMIRGIRQISESMGGNASRSLTQGEMMNRVTLAKSIFAKRDIKQGQTISNEDLEVKSPGQGLQPNRMEDLLGTVAKREFKEGDVFYPMDLEEGNITPRSYKFNTQWGLPVRHHDYKKLHSLCSSPVLEFHLSYKDLDLDNTKYFDGDVDAHLVIHAPELFENDHTLDLCSPDEEYRQTSIAHMKRTIDAAVRLRKYFNNADAKIGIVTNVGGFSSEGAFGKEEIAVREAILERSLLELQDLNAEIWPQTMPPFPWHFGGQQFHNLFLDADWIVDFCKRNNARVCLDISHSILHCNHTKQSPSLFLEKVLPFTAHLHLADGSGVDGEGLQINEGDVDFHLMAEKVRELCPEVTWIPEIWQGHEEEGKAFWIAFDRLEKAGF